MVECTVVVRETRVRFPPFALNEKESNQRMTRANDSLGGNSKIKLDGDWKRVVSRLIPFALDIHG